jgi:integrase/recombinase XerC
MPQTFQTYVTQFLDYLKFQKRYSQHTIISYKTDLLSFLTFTTKTFGETPLADIKATNVRSWLASCKEQGMESKSVNRKISCLKSFFKYLLRQQVIAASPMATVISPKVSKRLPQFVEKKDIETLFAHVEFEEGWQGQTKRLLIQLFYNTGMRQAELINLKETQFDAAKKVIKVLGKGNKERIIPISASIVAELTNYLQQKRATIEKPDTTVVFVNDNGKKLYPKYVYNAVKTYLSKVTTINKKSPHVLRHSFATHLMNNGAELNAVKELLGHSSLAATQIYTHNTIEKLKDIHKKAHPKA